MLFLGPFKMTFMFDSKQMQIKITVRHHFRSTGRAKGEKNKE